MAYTVLTATIANGAALSDAVTVTDKYIRAILIPALWDAAPLTFQGSIDGTNFYDVCNGGSEYALLATSAGQFLILDKPTLLTGFTKIKVRSGTSSSPVNQSADRSVGVATYQ